MFKYKTLFLENIFWDVVPVHGIYYGVFHGVTAGLRGWWPISWHDKACLDAKMLVVSRGGGHEFAVGRSEKARASGFMAFDFKTIKVYCSNAAPH